MILFKKIEGLFRALNPAYSCTSTRNPDENFPQTELQLLNDDGGSASTLLQPGIVS
jgi:hypothetical protein